MQSIYFGLPHHPTSETATLIWVGASNAHCYVLPCFWPSTEQKQSFYFFFFIIFLTGGQPGSADLDLVFSFSLVSP